MSKPKRILSWKVISFIVAVILAFPTWHYYIKDLLSAPGPIYYSQSDQQLKTVLNNSNIIENLSNYYKFDIEPALDLKVKEGYYKGSGSFKFFKSSKRKTYVSLLEDILSRNEDQIEYYINEDAKVIFIRPKTNLNDSSG